MYTNAVRLLAGTLDSQEATEEEIDFVEESPNPLPASGLSHFMSDTEGTAQNLHEENK